MVTLELIILLNRLLIQVHVEYSRHANQLEIFPNKTCSVLSFVQTIVSKVLVEEAGISTCYLDPGWSWRQAGETHQSESKAWCWQQSVLTFWVHILNLRNYCHGVFTYFSFTLSAKEQVISWVGSRDARQRLCGALKVLDGKMLYLLQMDLLMDRYVPSNALLDVENTTQMSFWRYGNNSKMELELFLPKVNAFKQMK